MPERYQDLLRTSLTPTLGVIHSDEQMQVQESDTEILDNLEPATTETEHWEAHSFQELIQRQENVMQTGELKKTNLAVVIGAPVYGKTFAGNQWAAEILRNIAGQGAAAIDVDTHDDTHLRLFDEKLDYYDFEWVTAVQAAVRLGLVESKPYGTWTPDDTSIFTEVSQRAIEVIREGTSGLPGIENNAIGLIIMKLPMVTAAGLGEIDEGYEYIGLDRGFNLLRQLQQDDDLGRSTFALPLITDAKSQQNRLTERTQLNTVQTVEDLRTWFVRTGISVPVGAEGYLEKLVEQLPRHSADVSAATAIAYQSDAVIRELAETDTVPLSQKEYRLVVKEMNLIEEGKLLTDPGLYKLQDARMGILAGRFYPKLIADVGLDARHGHVFRGMNTDVESVTIHPRVMTAHSLIDTIWRVNPSHLIPPSLS